MDEVRGLVEAALAGCLAELVDCDVVTGDAEGVRPDQYVCVVANAAESRARGAYLITVLIRIVVPVDDSTLVALARTRLRAICDYLDSNDCAFRSLNDGDVQICGFHLASMDNERGERSRSETITLKVGAAALMAG
jgi:hypothetical protein